MKLTDLYQTVTASILADLERGAPPWVKPWKGSAGGLMPVNAATHRHYHGINIPILWCAAEKKGYHRHAWMTFQQALHEGGAVRKGEHSTRIVFVKRLHVGEDEEARTVGMLRAYSVFNVAQIDGLPEPEPPPDIPEVERHQAAEVLITGTAADIRPGGNMAAYIPSHDYITMPDVQTFKGIEHYYATVLHELGHWTGAKHRLDRDLQNRFGTKSYAAEELVAEMTAAFLCAHLGIPGELRHSGYIGNWVELLKDDPRAIFTASSKASQAADYLRAFIEAPEADD